MNGSYILSKFRTHGPKKFVLPSPRAGAMTQMSIMSRGGKTNGVTFLETPGPGSYLMPSDFGIIETNRGKTQEGGSRPRISHRRNTVSQMSNHRDDISDFGDQVSIQQRSTLEGGRGAKFIGTAPVKGGHG